MICIIIAYAYVMMIMKKVKNIKILVAYNAIVMILLKIGYFMISYRIGFNRNSLDELIYAHATDTEIEEVKNRYSDYIYSYRLSTANFFSTLLIEFVIIIFVVEFFIKGVGGY